MDKDNTQKTSDGFLRLIEEKFETGDFDSNGYSALGLAYIGDAVYDMIVRTLVLGLGNGRVKNFHKITSSIVKAEAQAMMIREISGRLTEEEMAVYKRGRNAKSATSAKNASIVDYRIATGFEALLGYLYLNEKLGRAMELVKYGLEQTGQMPKHL